jgi:hypothetical protein
MFEVVRTSETSVIFYEITRRNIPENSHLNTMKYCCIRQYFTKRAYSKNIFSN